MSDQKKLVRYSYFDNYDQSTHENEIEITVGSSVGLNPEKLKYAVIDRWKQKGYKNGEPDSIEIMWEENIG
jgi:hypothetical protein